MSAGCYQTAPGDMDGVGVSDSDAPGETGDDVHTISTDIDTNTEDTNPTQTADTVTGGESSSEGSDVETDASAAGNHPCDTLGWDECIAQHDYCGRMYLEAVHYMSPFGVSASCETESLFYGCTSIKNCDDTFLLALDPDGRCWLMPTGCLPNEPGWKTATDDELCRTPIWEHSCED